MMTDIAFFNMQNVFGSHITQKVLKTAKIAFMDNVNKSKFYINFNKKGYIVCNNSKRIFRFRIEEDLMKKNIK